MQLEKSGAYLRESLKLIQNLENKFGKGGYDKYFAKIKLRVSLVLSKNPGFSQYKQNCYNNKWRKFKFKDEGIAELLLEDISSFKYAPIVSYDVERSFSKYKAMVCDNRKNFQFEYLKVSFITSCWYSFQN